MLSHLRVTTLGIILRSFNMAWNAGKVLLAWKQSAIVLILKPGKISSDPSNYRPITLTLQLGKTMERMVTDRGAMDYVLCLESEVRINIKKESLLAVMFDVEKAYDMLWRNGLLIKLNKFGIMGKMFNWVLDFLSKRTIKWVQNIHM